MNEIEGIMFVVFMGWVVISSVRNISKRRAIIRERANIEFHNEIDLTADELQERLSEAEFEYEDLEQTYWIHISILAAVCTQLILNTWYISLLLGFVLTFIGFKFLSIKPFSSGVVRQ